MARPAVVATLLATALSLAGCRSSPVQRNGPAQRVIIERTYRAAPAALREALLDSFTVHANSLPAPFRQMRAIQLKPPFYASDWLDNMVDPGGFLKPYKQIPAVERQDDLLLLEASGDFYWNSEYVNAAGPVKFRCEFILHFAEPAGGGTTVQVFEKVPSVWPGMYWTFGHSGPGWYRDIRFVEPTVQDRLDLLDQIYKLRAD